MFWKRRSRTFRTLISALVLFGLGYACLPQYWDSGYRPPAKEQEKCIPKRADLDPGKIRRPDDTIKVIHLTNDGQFEDRCEFTNAVNDLLCNRPDGKPNLHPKAAYRTVSCKDEQVLPKLTVLYIHGWKHDADETRLVHGKDLYDFSIFIQKLKTEHAGKKAVVGVYVTWNASGPFSGYLENLTFWNKKAIADRIAQTGTVTTIVSTLGALSNSSAFHKNQFIAIGHSFGARMLFSATNQTLLYETSRAHPGYPGGEYKLIKGAADAVILLNPAFDAATYSAVNAVTRGRSSLQDPGETVRSKEESFRPHQPPLLVAISTTGDDATRKYYRTGQWLAGRRSAIEATTLGNYHPYQTHTFLKADEASCPPTEDVSISERYYAEGICLLRLPRNPGQPRQANNPFIVASTDPSVIPNHSDIWNPTMSNWLVRFISQLEVNNETVLAKEFARSEAN